MTFLFCDDRRNRFRRDMCGCPARASGIFRNLSPARGRSAVMHCDGWVGSGWATVAPSGAAETGYARGIGNRCRRTGRFCRRGCRPVRRGRADCCGCRSPLPSNRNSLGSKELREPENSGCTKSCTRYPDLDRLSHLWPDLPETVRRAILDIAEASASSTEGRSESRQGAKP